jgi:putative phage-type endonuclease
MKQHVVVQGSDEWHALRASHYCASEAAAMLGLSPYMKRNELLHAKKTCGEKEFSDFVQKRVLDKGHEIEAATRPLAEAIIGEGLYPVTGSLEVEGLPLLASFDGITAGDDQVWENKQWNAELAVAIEAGELPPAYWPQLEQQLLISEAEKGLFTVSMDGTEANTRDLWYESKPERRKQLIAGWKQFDEDLKTYVPVEVIPAVKAAPVKQLPSIVWKREEGLSLTSNLDAFKLAAGQLVEDSKKKLETDQDFADCEALCKMFLDAEGKIELVKSQVLGEIEDVDQFSKDLDLIRESIRQARLNGEKQVKSRKDQIRFEILEKAKAALAAHISILVERLGKPYLPEIKADFAGVMKNKRTIASLRDAVDTELARAKIDANSIADRIDINLKKLVELASGHKDIFADAAQIVLKPTEDVVTLINYRIGEFNRKQEEQLAAERERMRKEEEAKARAAAEEKLRAEAAAKAKEEADTKAAEEAKARAELEAKTRQEAEEKARADAADKAKEDAEEKAYLEAEERARGGAMPAAVRPAPPSVVSPAVEAPAKPQAQPQPAGPAAVVTAIGREPSFTVERLHQLIGEALADMSRDDLERVYSALKAIKAQGTAGKAAA